MNFLKRFIGPSNALLFAYDHVEESSVESIEAEILDAKKYYHFVKVSELGLALREGRHHGLAAVVFRQARKSQFLRVFPFLKSESLPMTLFVIPDCIGTNRLSPAEEIEIFFQHYPEAFRGLNREEKCEEAWRDPEFAERFLKDCRFQVGPMPIDKLDPTRYGLTWGKLLEIPPELREIGLHLSAALPLEEIEKELAFISRQMSVATTSLYFPRGENHLMTGLSGVSSVILEKSGVIEKDTNPLTLPIWNRES